MDKLKYPLLVTTVMHQKLKVDTSLSFRVGLTPKYNLFFP